VEDVRGRAVKIRSRAPVWLLKSVSSMRAESDSDECAQAVATSMYRLHTYSTRGEQGKVFFAFNCYRTLICYY